MSKHESDVVKTLEIETERQRQIAESNGVPLHRTQHQKDLKPVWMKQEK